MPDEVEQASAKTPHWAVLQILGEVEGTSHP